MSSSAASSLRSKRKKGTVEDPINLDSDLSSGLGSDVDVDFSSSSKRVKTCASSSPPSLNTTLPSSSYSASKTSHPLYDASASASASISVPDPDSGSESEPDSTGIDMDNAGPKPDYAGKYFDLDHMMRRLDRSSRTKHMDVLANDLQTIRTQLAEFESMVETYEESYDDNTAEFQSKLRRYNALKSQGFAPKHTLDAKRAELHFLEEELEEENQEVGCVRQAQRYFKQWVAGLSDVRDTFTQLWDVYDSMTKPGPSSAPVQARELWDHGYGVQLHGALQEACAKVVRAEAEVKACLAYLRESNESETEGSEQ